MYYILSDIHGHYDILKQRLLQIEAINAENGRNAEV